MLFWAGLCLLSCKTPGQESAEQKANYPVVDYVKVGKIMDTVKTPYVIDIAVNKKRLVFIGCIHDVDSTHPQFRSIGRYFNDLHPQLALNEGGQIPDSIHYLSVNDAIRKGGETGMLKYYADQSGIRMLNGDMDVKTEFALTLKKIPKNELYLYYVMERIVIPYHYGAYGKESFNTVFKRIVNNYFVKNGFPLSDEEREVRYFESLYKKEIKKEFDISNFDIEAFDYINDNCRYCAVGRVSKTTRDSVLLSKIDAALNNHDRIIVTFGHGHALAVEPALREIMKKKR